MPRVAVIVWVSCLFVAGCGGGGSGGSNIGVNVRVPDVVGLDQTAATTAITAAGLAVGKIASAGDAVVPIGNVVSQMPIAGSSVAPQTPVDLTVSSGATPFGIDTRPALAPFVLPTSGSSAGVFDVVAAFPNLTFSNATFVSGVPGDTRLVVVQQSGQLRAFAPSPGVANSRLILDVSSKLVFGGEQGLLGLAFDPDFATNRFIYVDYSRAGDGATVVARYTWVGGATDSASLASEKIILTVDQPAPNHNGGMLAFGPDGYLYVAMGDGGGGDDQFHNGQNLNSLLATILRIDVHPANAADPYAIPSDNPFVGRANTRPEIWAYGLRNPFRFSFDRQTGQLWIGDVGQNQTEEIDLGAAGANYGWPRFEGSQLYQPGTALAGPSPHTPPIYEFDHSLGIAIIGGYVYRGTRIASLIGKYLYSDYGSGTVWALDYDGTHPPVNAELATASNPTSFGEDDTGEVYIVSQNAGLFRLEEAGGGGNAPALLSQTGLFSDLATLTPAAGLIEYDLNLPFWSDGAMKRRWVAVPVAAKVAFSPTGAWTFPVGTVIVKHFEMQMTEGDPNSARRLETRVLTRGANGWLGFTYRWNAAQTDADLLVGGESETLTINTGSGTRMQQYDYPSRTDCLRCHTQAAGSVLGLATRQLNRDFDYALVSDNQLRTLNHIGYFNTDIGAASQYGAYPAIDDADRPVASRARAYLAVNCAQCHRPGGPTNVNLDLRFDTADASMNAIDIVPVAGDLGIGAAARIIAPGDRSNSILWQRMQRLDSTRMPPLASHAVDAAAIDVIGSWIDAL